MDNQDHRKAQTPGHDNSSNNQGVHICNKCQWPFPNPHPSAKHRRAHKKICGKIEGYKLVDSDLINSDSDDDHKTPTPSPRVLEISSNEKGSGAIGDRSSRSEEEVFADAVAEFSDSTSGKGIEESPDDFKKQLEVVDTIVDSGARTSLFFEDTAISDFHDSIVKLCIIPPTSSSADSSHLQNAGVLKSNLSGSAQDYENQVPVPIMDSAGRHLSVDRTEESVSKSSGDKGGSTSDSNAIQVNSNTDELPKNNERTVYEDAEQNEPPQDGKTETDTKAIEKIHKDEQFLDIEVLSSDNSGKASENLSGPGKQEVKTSDVFHDKLESGVLLNDPSSEVQSIEHLDCAHTSHQTKEKAIQEVGSGDSHNLVENTDDGKALGSENVHVFSVPGDIYVVENAEAMIRGFKDPEGGKLPQLVDVDSLELNNEVKESVRTDDVFGSCSIQTKGTVVSVSDVDALGSSIEQTGDNNELPIEKFPVETECDRPQDKVTINESQTMEGYGTHSYSSGIESDKIHAVEISAEQLPDSKISSQASSSDHVTEILIYSSPVTCIIDNEVLQITNIVGAEDIADDQKSRVVEVIDVNPTAATLDAGVGEITSIVGVEGTGDVDKNIVERSDIADNDAGKVVKEDGCLENVEATSAEGKSLNESEIETGIGDSTSESTERNHLVKTSVFEPANDLEETKAMSENVINLSASNLSESEGIQLSRTSDNLGVKELAGSDHGKLGVDSSASSGAAAKSGNSRVGEDLQKTSEDVEVLQKHSDDIDDLKVLQKPPEALVAVEPRFSPLDANTPVETCPKVGDNSARDFVGVAPENSLPEDSENKSVTQQLGASATDLSVDSGSQTDSLEGHWGSVSVLSTQSDLPANLDADPLLSTGLKASADAEKTDMQKQRTIPEGQQHSDKSDTFEPPSFMTLVEPRGGDKATASEIQTIQNTQQPKAASLQAGWFPSLTNVVNESQGRKKNEEIIAKVTNWSAGKQHTPLKNLLGEANSPTKSKLPNVKENPTPVIQKDETAAKENVGLPETVNSILGAEKPADQSVKKEIGKEWNSPARYPVDIKREKKKEKGRPYWAQFMCCSSVN